MYIHNIPMFVGWSPSLLVDLDLPILTEDPSGLRRAAVCCAMASMRYAAPDGSHGSGYKPKTTVVLCDILGENNCLFC